MNFFSFFSFQSQKTNKDGDEIVDQKSADASQLDSSLADLSLEDPDNVCTAFKLIIQRSFKNKFIIFSLLQPCENWRGFGKEVLPKTHRKQRSVHSILNKQV